MKNAVFWGVAPCRRAHAGSSLADFSTQKMEAIRSSETSVQSTTSTRRHTPEDGILHSHRRENVKSYKHTYCLQWLLLKPYLPLVSFSVLALRSEMQCTGEYATLWVLISLQVCRHFLPVWVPERTGWARALGNHKTEANCTKKEFILIKYT
jgi:hypothetical protein